jgi:hypothetical protein
MIPTHTPLEETYFIFPMASQASSPIQSPRRSRPAGNSNLDSYLNNQRQQQQEKHAIRNMEID